MTRRGQILPRTIIISFGLFLLVLGVGVWLISEAANTEPSFTENQNLTQFNNTFNKFAEYNSGVTDLRNSTENVVGNPDGAFGFLNSLINQAWNTLRLLFSSFSFMAAVISSLSDVFGIPTFMTALAVTMIVSLFIFGMLRVIFNRDI